MQGSQKQECLLLLQCHVSFLAVFLHVFSVFLLPASSWMCLASKDWFECHQYQDSDECLHVIEGVVQTAAGLVVLHVLLSIFSHESEEAQLVTCLPTLLASHPDVLQTPTLPTPCLHVFCPAQNQKGGEKGQHKTREKQHGGFGHVSLADNAVAPCHAGETATLCLHLISWLNCRARRCSCTYL